MDFAVVPRLDDHHRMSFELALNSPADVEAIVVGCVLAEDEGMWQVGEKKKKKKKRQSRSDHRSNFSRSHRGIQSGAGQLQLQHPSERG